MWVQYGDVYGRTSNCLEIIDAGCKQMVNLPDVENDMRKELNIPHDATVFKNRGNGSTTYQMFIKL